MMSRDPSQSERLRALERRYKRKVLDLLTLHEIADHLAGLRDYQEVVEYLLQIVRGHLGLRALCFLRRGEAALVPVASKGLRAGAAPPSVELALPGVAALLAAAGCRPVATLAGDQEAALLLDRLAPLAAETLLPVRHQDEALGLLVLGPKLSGAALDDDEREYLDILANHLGVTLANAAHCAQLRTAEQQLQESYARLQELDRSRSSFVALASHELHTPVSVIDLSLFALRHAGETGDREGLEETFRIVGGALTRLKEITADLIEVARGEEPARRLLRSPVRVATVLDEVLPVVRAYLRERPNIAFDVQLAEPLPVLALDGPRLVRVYLALLQNAIKFIPPERPGRLLLRVWWDEAARALTSAVEDNGIGIPAALRTRVFERFYEGGDIDHHHSSKTAFLGGGFGLGLSVAQRIVADHGGRIWIEDSPFDSGVRVAFTLPEPAP